MKYNIMYRADIASYTRKNRERSIFYLTHYTYQYIWKFHHINILKPLSSHFQPLLNIYRTTIERLSNHYWTTEHLSNIYPNHNRISHVNIFKPLSNHFLTIIEHLSNYYRTSIRPLLNHWTSTEHPSDH